MWLNAAIALQLVFLSLIAGLKLALLLLMVNNGSRVATAIAL
jgi:hypothetical protein